MDKFDMSQPDPSSALQPDSSPPVPSGPGGAEPGDAAVARIYQSLVPVANGLVAKTGRPDLEAASILARAFTRWLPQRDRWINRMDEARRYLITCMKHEIVDQVNRTPGAPLTTDPSDVPHPQPAPPEDQRLVRQALESVDLPSRLGEIAILRVVEGHEWKPIADRIGSTEGAVKVLWSRKRNMVAKALIELASAELGTLNLVIASKVLVERIEPGALVELMGLQPEELTDRIECEILPVLTARLGSAGIDALHRIVH